MRHVSHPELNLVSNRYLRCLNSRSLWSKKIIIRYGRKFYHRFLTRLWILPCVPPDGVTSNYIGNFELFHFSALIFNESATNVFLKIFFPWISIMTFLNCVSVVFDPSNEVKLRLLTLFFPTDLPETRCIYLKSYCNVVMM